MLGCRRRRRRRPLYLFCCHCPITKAKAKASALRIGLAGSARVDCRDTLQVHPCKLRRRIHAAQGPANPPAPTLDSWLVRREKRGETGWAPGGFESVVPAAGRQPRRPSRADGVACDGRDPDCALPSSGPLPALASSPINHGASRRRWRDAARPPQWRPAPVLHHQAKEPPWSSRRAPTGAGCGGEGGGPQACRARLGAGRIAPSQPHQIKQKA